MIANVIHLPNREDRMNNLVREADEQGFRYRIHQGTTGHQFAFMNVKDSHQKIVSFAKHTSKKEILIMEDDVCFTAPGAFDYFIKNKPVDYDIYLSSVYHGFIKEDNTIDDFCALHCYIIHERFYDTFLSIQGLQHIDRALSGKGRFVVCHPFVCTQMNGYSDNKQMVATYGHLMEGREFFK